MGLPKRNIINSQPESHKTKMVLSSGFVFLLTDVIPPGRLLNAVNALNVQYSRVVGSEYCGRKSTFLGRECLLRRISGFSFGTNYRLAQTGRFSLFRRLLLWLFVGLKIILKWERSDGASFRLEIRSGALSEFETEINKRLWFAFFGLMIKLTNET